MLAHVLRGRFARTATFQIRYRLRCLRSYPFHSPKGLEKPGFRRVPFGCLV
jgi:hypothetical protein